MTQDAKISTGQGSTSARKEVTIKGQLSRIRFTNEDGSFAVCELTSEKYPLPITIVGNILATQPGESVEVAGYFVDDPRFGRQLKIERLKAVLPSSKAGIERYLGGGFIDGIGPVLAERIVEMFGEETLDLLDESPEKLLDVEGIGKGRYERILKAWQEQRTIRDVMVFLQMHRISTTFATKIYRIYGDRSPTIIQNDPYKLAEDIYGIGFRKADAIARSTGIEPDALARLRAGLVFALREAHSDGHMYLPMDELLAKSCELLDLQSADGLGDALESLRQEDKIVVEPDEDGGTSRVWRKGAWHVEVNAARHLKRLMSSGAGDRLFATFDTSDEALASATAKLGVTLDPLQEKAVKAAWEHKVVVITGGPGTGKTTIIRAVVELGRAQNAVLHLAAPTGRAAKRLSEATDEKASTLHRLLDYSFQQGFQVNENSPLETDMLIVDESSMMDTYLLHAVTAALPDHARLVLVGDIDQLPSVGPGNVLRDVIDSGEVGVVRLTRIFRQARESSIVLNAHRINHGELPVVPDHSKGAVDFYAINAEEPVEAQKKILEMVTKRMPKAFGFDAIRDVQILAPMHRGDVGCARLNELLQNALNPRGEEITRAGRTFRVGDKVMQQRNNYDQDVFNGDVGVVAALEHDTQQMVVDFGDGKEARYAFTDIDELVLAYAITVHKSQGSEYRVVVIPVVTQHYIMLQRNLLYTAVTRAREMVVLVGTQKAVGIAVRNETALGRYTRLAQRLAVS